jgi:hypothetical protein
MPIDPNIALGVKPIQLESPINQMAKMYEMQNAVQSNKLNQMKMDEYQRGLASNQEIKNYLANTSPKDPNYITGAYAIDPEFGMKLDKNRTEVAKEQALTKSAELEQLTKIHGLVKTGATRVLADPRQATARGILKEIARQTGADMTADYAELDAIGENPAGLTRWAASHAFEADKLLPKSDKLDLDGSVQDRTIDPLTGIPKVVGTTQKTLAPSSDIPKLKPGEKWDSTTQTVKQVPGSAEYNKQSKIHGTDYNAAKTVLSKMDNAISKVDEILKPENKSGFENNFGGYNAAVSRMFTGDTARVRKNIDSLKADMKSAGLELVRAGGSIGALTEREWPMLEAQIDAIDYMLDEKDAVAAFNRVKSTFERIKDQAKDTYQTTWGETQYYKPEVNKGAPPPPPGKRNAADEAAYQAYVKAHPGAKK